MRSTLSVIFAISCFQAMSGCDRFSTVRQTVVIKVANLDSGVSVRGAIVEIHDAHDSEGLEGDRYWVWDSATTDDNGCAEIASFSACDANGSFDATPPAETDILTGSSYLVRIAVDGRPPETIRLKLNPGQAGDGRSYSATVVRIGVPHYVRPKNQTTAEILRLLGIAVIILVITWGVIDFRGRIVQKLERGSGR